jgi:hypothetical protein
MALEICDLNKTPSSQFATFDFCIVGAGAIGCYIAKVLSGLGASVALVDAGGHQTQSGEEIGFQAISSGDRYGGLKEGRWFGFGGSTAHWGGALVPHSEHDILVGGADYETWKSTINKVRVCKAKVLKNLDYPAKTEFQVPGALPSRVIRDFADQGLVTEAALYLPFRSKNFKSLLRAQSGAGTVNLLLNATAASWSLTNRGIDFKVKVLKCRTTGGQEIAVEANKYIIAAGALESTRILLEIDQACEALCSTATPLASTELGSGLGDHLSMPIGECTGAAAGRLIELFRPCFESSWMKSFRFLVPDQMQETGTRFFVHFIFDTDTPGLRVAKSFLRDLQRSTLPRVKLGELARGTTELLNLGFDRFLSQRMFISKKTKVLIQLDCEQQRSNENRIRLSTERDIYGRNKLELKWKINPEDYATFSRISQGVLNRLKSLIPEIGKYGPAGSSNGTLIKPYDAYHPVGTCRMGEDANGVVDFNLAVRGFENLFSVSTAVLPTAGTANPTFTALCLSHELCQQLI